jgi:hypothetical protein
MIETNSNYQHPRIAPRGGLGGETLTPPPLPSSPLSPSPPLAYTTGQRPLVAGGGGILFDSCCGSSRWWAWVFLHSRLFLGHSPAALQRQRVWRGASRHRVVQHTTVTPSDGLMLHCGSTAAIPNGVFPLCCVGLLGGPGGGASRLQTWARLDLPSLARQWCGLGQIERDLARAILLLSILGSASPPRIVLAG